MNLCLSRPRPARSAGNRMLLRVVLATALVLLSIADTRPQASGLDVAPHLKKLDGLLRLDVDQQAGGARRVLIRTTAADKETLRRLLAAQGHQILADLDEDDTLSVVVPAESLEALAKSGKILGISADAVVRPHSDLLGGLLGTASRTVTGTAGLLVGTVGTILDTVGNILDPALDDASAGEPVPPAVLRATLGLQDSWTGTGVTVAVIDSGLEMSTEFQGRVKAFYDFTGGKTQSTSPFDDYGHGTHVAGHDCRLGRAVVEQGLPWPRAERAAGRAEGARRHRRRLHERRRPRHRLRRGEQEQVRHRRHQPVARPPDLRAGVDRPAGAGGGARVEGRHHRAGGGRQQRREPDDGAARLRRRQLARQRAVGHHGGRRGHEQHGDAQRRSHPGLQLVGSRPGTTRS